MKAFILITLLILFIRDESVLAYDKYQIDCPNELLIRSKTIALSQAGICETSNRNDGLVEKYLAAVNMKKGQPYCAAGVYWCFLMAANELGFSENQIPIPKTASVAKFLKFAKLNYSKSNLAISDNSLIIWLNNRKTRGHIERIIKIKKAGWVETIAFNSHSDDKTNKHEGVYIKQRNIIHPIGRLKMQCIIILNAV